MIVLDAAAMVDVVLDQSAKHWVLEQLRGQVVCAPAHQPAEVLSAIARLRRADEIDDQVAQAALLEVDDLEQELVPPTGAHMTRALELQERVHFLDGLYVALAAERKCPLVTTDHRLARAEPPCQVHVPDEPEAT
ncbi:MAG TPA: PIN domain-containing protein [Egibacteraceae bacterium]|jgi:predicted nucleic acid-binding protein|nr:PIN domain-containing protein [Egibacteraceae bacterium]